MDEQFSMGGEYANVEQHDISALAPGCFFVCTKGTILFRNWKICFCYIWDELGVIRTR